MSLAAAAEAAAAAAAAADWLLPVGPPEDERPPTPPEPSPGINPPASGYLSFFINVLVFLLGLKKIGKP